MTTQYISSNLGDMNHRRAFYIIDVALHGPHHGLQHTLLQVEGVCGVLRRA